MEHLIAIPPEEQAERTRKFTSIDGKFSVEAMLVTMRDWVVYLQKVSNAEQIEVPMEKLSNFDKVWIRRIVAADKKKAAEKK